MKTRKAPKSSAPRKRARSARRKPKIPTDVKTMDYYLGTLLRARREELGLTREEVFAGSDIPTRHLEYIEAGNPFPFDAVCRLQAVLRFKVVAFLRKAEAIYLPERARLEKLGWKQKPLRGLQGSFALDWYDRDPWKIRMWTPLRRPA